MTEQPPVVPAPPPQPTIQIVQPAAKSPATKAPAAAKPATPPLVQPRHRGPAAAVAGGALGVASLGGWLAAGPAGLGIAAGTVAAGAGMVVAAKRARVERQDPAAQAAAKAIRQATRQGMRLPQGRLRPGASQAPRPSGAASPSRTAPAGRSAAPAGRGRLFGRRTAGTTPRAGAAATAPAGRAPGATSGRPTPQANPATAQRHAATAAPRRGPLGRAHDRMKLVPGTPDHAAHLQRRAERAAAAGRPRREQRARAQARKWSGRTPDPGTAEQFRRVANRPPATGDPALRPAPPSSGRRSRPGSAAPTRQRPASRVSASRPSWPTRPAEQRRASEDAAARAAIRDAARTAPKQPAQAPPSAGPARRPGLRRRPGRAPAPGATPPAAPAPAGKPPLRDMPKQVNGGARDLPTTFNRRATRQPGTPGRTDHRFALRNLLRTPKPAAPGSSPTAADAKTQGSEDGPSHGAKPDDRPAALAEKSTSRGQAAVPPAAPQRTRRQQLHDSLWPEGGRHRARGGAVSADPTSPDWTFTEEAVALSGMTNPPAHRLADLYGSEGAGAQMNGSGPVGRTPKEKYDSLYKTFRTSGQSREDARAAAIRGSGYNPGGSTGGGRGGTSAGGPIQSMQDDFPAIVAQLRRTVEDAAATARGQIMAITEGSPSSSAVKDAATQWVDAFTAHAEKADDLNGLSRQVDAVGYEAQERYGRDPNAGAWMGRG